MRNFLQTDIYGITCEELSCGRDNIEVVRQMILAGIQVIQYREKEKTKRQKYEQCLAISKMCQAADVLFIVNDDVDIALMVKAGGVHVGQDDLPADAVRKLVGEEMIIGVSAGNPEEAAEAAFRGADYLGIGPVFSTGTKPDAGEAVGYDFVDFMVQNSSLPLVAVGGINAENIENVYRRGVHCAAMVSALVGAPDLCAAVKSLRLRIKKNR